MMQLKMKQAQGRVHILKFLKSKSERILSQTSLMRNALRLIHPSFKIGPSILEDVLC